jgi:hypothetical protein
MAIKDKVLASCKTSYAKYGLKKDELSRLVDNLIANRSLTDESSDEDVSGAVTAFEPMVGLMQSMFNRAVSETDKKYEGWKKPEPLTPPVPQPETLTAEMVTKMIADATANNQKTIADAVAAAVAPFKEKEEKQRLASLLQKSEKLKGIPESFRSRYQLDKEENLDSMTEQITNDFTALKQQLVSSGAFVEAPRQTSPQTEQDDFIKRMQEFGERNAAEGNK